MSELSEAIGMMRNMRESYDELGAAAEAYNVGKTELAANITNKGVQADASETLPELAQKVNSISQESYTIDGGEMYAMQIVGSLEAPNFWNLYEVLANLLSDGRLVEYGGILLAEYYRGYDSLALAGAGAGGAYVVSDRDENGQFKMYTEDTTHVWDTEFDGKANRWMAYCFAEEWHDVTITDTNTSPRSIFIGRKVGTIRWLVNGRCSQIVVPDGNKLISFNSAGYSQQWEKRIVFRNMQKFDVSTPFGSSMSSTESIYLECDEILNGNIFSVQSGVTVILKTNRIYNTSSYGLFHNVNVPFAIIRADSITGMLTRNGGGNTINIALFVESASKGTVIHFFFGQITSLYLGYLLNDKSRSVNLSGGDNQNTRRFYLQDGWCKPLTMIIFTALTEEDINSNVLKRLKQDEPNCGDGVTITLGATNLAKLTSQESIELLAELTDTYGYTFA